MPQYGAGVSFSKMKRSMDKTRAQTEEKKKRKQRRVPKSSRQKTRRQKTRRPRAQGSKKNKTVSLHQNACQCGTHHYTGSEPTPRGLGNCEECIPLHVVLRGKDGQLYENRGNMWSLL